MSRYFKILLITAGIQVGALFLGFILYNVPIQAEILKNAGLFLFVANVPVSVIVGIILAIKWGRTVKEKLIYIFLMPTNYTWILYFLAVGSFVNKIIDILIGVPDDNFSKILAVKVVDNWYYVTGE